MRHSLEEKTKLLQRVRQVRTPSSARSTPTLIVPRSCN